ncbi:MAG: NAD(P)-binding protein [Acidimicrobiaceae bacterium]|nr:NAD(P)-binding protein [Acidimicrobiaceae bacterium]
MTERRPFAITLDMGSSLANRTGTWRTERPVYVHRLPPCSAGCPAAEDIQGWLYHAEEGGYESAWRVIMEKNPLPAIMGRACFHPCESGCNRVQVDEAVGINAVERFLGDLALERNWHVPPGPATGRRVAVVGSGPGGLSSAYHLRRRGHDVVVFEAQEDLGGMMRYGIPAYRLPRDVVSAEIARLAEMGVRFEVSHWVNDVHDLLREGFEAVVVAVGAQRGRDPGIPAGDAARILDAVGVLRSLEEGDPPALGRRVVVYGGGDTAMDAARTATRLGATETVVVYRRTRDVMPAHDEEVLDAEAEGVQMRWLSTIARADEDQMMIEKMRLDDQGRAVGTGEFEEFVADTVVLALGQEADLDLVEKVNGVTVTDGAVVCDEFQRTGDPRVFVVGDASSNGADSRTLTRAIGQGRLCAEAVDALLLHRDAQPDPQLAPAGAERLNTWYYADAERTVRPRLEVARRRDTFSEVVGGLTVEDALFEARRCMSCGNCFECDNCFGVCPDNAVIKLGPGQGYAFNYDYCKGCGICVAECPCGAIDLIPEPR